MRTASSGISGLDEFLNGLWAGDNVVWVATPETSIATIERSFLLERLRLGEPCTYVTTEQTPARLRSEFGNGLRVLDARPGRPLADPTALQLRILDDARLAPGRVVVDSLDAFVRRLGRTRALGLFSRVSPSSTTSAPSPTGVSAGPPPGPASWTASPRSPSACSNCVVPASEW